MHPQVVNIVRDHRHQCAVVSSCTRIINADASKAQRLLYQRRRKAVKISTKVSCEVCARPLSAPAAPVAGAAVASAASAASSVLTFGCGHIFHGTVYLACSARCSVSYERHQTEPHAACSLVFTCRRCRNAGCAREPQPVVRGVPPQGKGGSGQEELVVAGVRSIKCWDCRR